MSFVVHWRLSALNELANIWTEAASEIRHQVTHATARIDQRLKTGADREGESRLANRRVLFEPPLGILYAFDSDRGEASVLEVWTYSKRA